MTPRDRWILYGMWGNFDALEKLEVLIFAILGVNLKKTFNLFLLSLR